jgi:quinoprotein glucose dehydrogenase
MHNCLPCHGPDRARITFPASIDENRFKTVLRNGERDMPSFSEGSLLPQFVDSLIAYFRNPKAGAPNKNVTTAKGSAPSGPTRYYGPFGSILANNRLIAMGPPWCEVVAYDLNEGTIKWRFPLGTTPGLATVGVKNTGSSSFLRNGPVVTAGGLIFIASGADRMVHAYDKGTGKLLWETEVDANPDGIPAVYEAGGREYVAFLATSDQSKDAFDFKAGKPGSQGYYVFALPEDSIIQKLLHFASGPRP